MAAYSVDEVIAGSHTNTGATSTQRRAACPAVGVWAVALHRTQTRCPITTTDSVQPNHNNNLHSLSQTILLSTSRKLFQSSRKFKKARAIIKFKKSLRDHFKKALATHKSSHKVCRSSSSLILRIVIWRQVNTVIIMTYLWLHSFNYLLYTTL